MEFNIKPNLVLIFSSLLLFSSDAHRMITMDPPSPSHPPRTACKTLFSPLHDQFEPLTFNINPTLSNICHVTKDPTKCIALVSPCIRTASIDSFSALEAVVISLLEHVEHAVSFALKLSKNRSTSSDVLLAALNSCVELYVKIIDDLEKALAAFKAHDFVTVNTMLTAAITKFGRCDEVFHQQGLSKNNPLEKIDHMLIQLAGFGIDINEKLIVNVYHINQNSKL